MVAAVVVALVLTVGWLFVRAARRRGSEQGGGARPWVLAVVAAGLVGWFAVDQLVVSSSRLADTLDRVYVVAAPGEVPGPVGLLVAAELELDTDLLMENGPRETTDSGEELTSFDVSHRLLGVPVGRACLTERLVEVDGEDLRSYTVESGRCA